MPATSVRPLCPELALKAKVELNETPQKLQDGIQHLKEWIAKQPHLRARTDDQWLVTFLRGCKYSLERAKEKLDMYYTMRSIAPDMFEVSFRDPKFDAIIKSGIGMILPERVNPADPRVVIVRVSPYDTVKFQPPDFFALAQVVLQIILMEDDPFVIAGVHLVLDMNGMVMSHLAHITPGNMKKVVVLAQDASPTRLKSVHLIGIPSFFQVMVNLFKQFLNEKNRRKIHVHQGSYDELYKHISKDVLPKEYGGNGGTFQELTDHLVNKIAEHSAFLKEDLQYGTDETKRLGKPRTAESLLGVDGSFRQLDFD